MCVCVFVLLGEVAEASVKTKPNFLSRFARVNSSSGAVGEATETDTDTHICQTHTHTTSGHDTHQGPPQSMPQHQHQQGLMSVHNTASDACQSMGGDDSYPGDVERGTVAGSVQAGLLPGGRWWAPASSGGRSGGRDAGLAHGGRVAGPVSEGSNSNVTVRFTTVRQSSVTHASQHAFGLISDAMTHSIRHLLTQAHFLAAQQRAIAKEGRDCNVSATTLVCICVCVCVCHRSTVRVPLPPPTPFTPPLAPPLTSPPLSRTTAPR